MACVMPRVEHSKWLRWPWRVSTGWYGWSSVAQRAQWAFVTSIATACGAGSRTFSMAELPVLEPRQVLGADRISAPRADRIPFSTVGTTFCVRRVHSVPYTVHCGCQTHWGSLPERAPDNSSSRRRHGTCEFAGHHLRETCS